MAARIAAVVPVIVGFALVALSTWGKLDTQGRQLTLAGLALMIWGAWWVGRRWPHRRSSHPTVPADDLPEASLERLAQRVLETNDPWCFTRKAIEQGGAVVGLVLARHLAWWVSTIGRQIRYYLHEWGRESKVGEQSVTKMFYEFARRASIEMRESEFDARYEHLIQLHPVLNEFWTEAHQLVSEFRTLVEDPLRLARSQADASEVQREAAANVEQLLQRTSTLQGDIENWQSDARASAADLRRRLLTAG